MKVKLVFLPKSKTEEQRVIINLTVDEACDLHSILIDLNENPKFISNLNEGEKKTFGDLVDKLDKEL